MPIVAMGGFPDETLLGYVLGLTGGRRVLYVPTAGLEDPASTVTWFERLRGRAEMTLLSFYPWPPATLRELTLEQDLVIVTGGNTANMLATWRTHGFDMILREAWERDIVLVGWSAGAICWFEWGVTDSFGPQLERMQCLGFLQGSACPHYDGEELRRPRYGDLLREGMPPGLAIDDDAAIRFDGTELTDVVASRAGATAYHVTADGEATLEARMLQ